MNPALLQVVGLAWPPAPGQAAFVTVYLLLLAGIIWLPKALLDTTGPAVIWWKNPRFWAAVICIVQILVYGLLG